MEGFDMIFEMLKGFLTEIMFKAAGILGGCLFIYTDAYEPVCKNSVALINARSGGSALFGEGYIAILVHFYKSAVFEKSHRAADARL